MSLQRIVANARVHSRHGAVLTSTSGVFTCADEALPEFTVLEELLRADGGVVSAEHLLDKAWDEHIQPFSNIVRVTMATLRKKLGEPVVIETVTGVGYRL